MTEGNPNKLLDQDQDWRESMGAFFFYWGFALPIAVKHYAFGPTLSAFFHNQKNTPYQEFYCSN